MAVSALIYVAYFSFHQDIAEPIFKQVLDIGRQFGNAGYVESKWNLIVHADKIRLPSKNIHLSHQALTI
jgi:hypothetical protein